MAKQKQQVEFNYSTLSYLCVLLTYTHFKMTIVLANPTSIHNNLTTFQVYKKITSLVIVNI